MLIFFTLFLTLQGTAQQFEWVRGFALGENVTTVVSVTDSLATSTSSSL